jgi:hypothetical protein
MRLENHYTIVAFGLQAISRALQGISKDPCENR